MSDAKLVNIARLMTTYNLEFEQLPDNLKCAQCKLVLKDACHGPCCCRYCRACIDGMMASGGEFCPGDSEECGESALSRFVSDYASNKGVSRLAVICPHDGCVHVCRLINMEDHLRVCQRKSEECPFCKLGCTQDKLAVEEIGGHLQRENRSHSEILFEMIVNINKEIVTLKWRDEASIKEIEMLKRRDEVSNREIETLKERDEASHKEIEALKHELVLKDGQIRLIIDQMIHVENESKSIKNDIKSIKEEKEDLAGTVKTVLEENDRKIAERRENDELDNASRLVEHVDREIAAVTGLIGSNKNELDTEMQSVRGDIGSINQGIQSLKDNICSVQSQVNSIQAFMGLRNFDASCVWLIDDDVGQTHWFWGDRQSEYFSGAVLPYKYRLGSSNYQIGTPLATLRIQLLIYAEPTDGQLVWPFDATVIITVSDRDIHEACGSISLPCRIERPPDTSWRRSDAFEFFHSDLIEAGLNLSGGVNVSCVIVSGSVNDV